jgi:acyl-CoA reductase-like NAD-dependent aldehyde dehydrogenase
VQYRSTNPHAPEEVVATFDALTADQVGASVDKASAAGERWRSAPAHARQAALVALATLIEQTSEELAQLIVREVGKPILEARGEVQRAVAIHRYFAQAALGSDGATHPSTSAAGWLFTRRRPVGVCGLVTPWNFPLAIPSWKAAPAIAFGNTAVLKPAPEGTSVAQRYVELAGSVLPASVLELAPGDADTGAALVGHPAVAAVSFTGSRAVGVEVARIALERGARVQCEMSGDNASVVLADANQEAAARAIATAAMGYAGQKCTATGRVIVEDTIADSFTERLVAAVERMTLVEPADEACLVGPMISEQAVRSAQAAVERLDGRVLTGGGPEPGQRGSYLRPTLIAVNAADQASVGEIFAPVATVATAPDAAAALAAANASPLGLVAAVFTSRLDRAMQYVDGLDTGLVRVNAPTSGVDYHVPFGGLKGSSIGAREQGEAARAFFSEERTVLVESLA